MVDALMGGMAVELKRKLENAVIVYEEEGELKPFG